MKQLEYSILKYHSQQFNENIVLGILLSDKNNKQHNFYYIENLEILLKYKEEINCDLVKKLLESIKEETKNTNFDIHKFIKYYINDFYFEKIQIVNYNNWNNIKNKLLEYFKNH